MIIILSTGCVDTLNTDNQKIWRNLTLIEKITSVEKFPSGTTTLRIDQVKLVEKNFIVTIAPLRKFSLNNGTVDYDFTSHQPLTLSIHRDTVTELAQSLSSSSQEPSTSNSQNAPGEYKSIFSKSTESLLNDANAAAKKAKTIDDFFYMPDSIKQALLAVTKPQNGKLSPEACIEHFTKNPQELKGDIAFLGFYIDHLIRSDNDRKGAHDIAEMIALNHPIQNGKADGFYTLGKIDLAYGSFKKAYDNFKKCKTLTSDEETRNKAQAKQDYCASKLKPSSPTMPLIPMYHRR